MCVYVVSKYHIIVFVTKRYYSCASINTIKVQLAINVNRAMLGHRYTNPRHLIVSNG